MWSYLGDSANWAGATGIWARLGEHLRFVGISMGLSVLLALPVAIVTGHVGRFGFLAVNVSNIGRAIPSLAFLALFATILPRGYSSSWPTILALIALAAPPLVTNTYVGVRHADPDAVGAAVAIGMSPRQVALRVEVPLAAPMIIAGLRTALTNVIATATLAALVTQGGLGRLIVDGQAQANRPMQIAGAVLVAVLALIGDGLLVLVAWRIGRRP
ncbi:MAG: ABC transporter permease [Frankiaceae bacterium]|jgi:osmoprotectant transport system permease protein|nr:ABC transporter permease [Frankiaceae bacterium]